MVGVKLVVCRVCGDKMEHDYRHVCESCLKKSIEEERLEHENEMELK